MQTYKGIVAYGSKYHDTVITEKALQSLVRDFESVPVYKYKVVNGRLKKVPIGALVEIHLDTNVVKGTIELDDEWSEEVLSKMIGSGSEDMLSIGLNFNAIVDAERNIVKVTEVRGAAIQIKKFGVQD